MLYYFPVAVRQSSFIGSHYSKKSRKAYRKKGEKIVKYREKTGEIFILYIGKGLGRGDGRTAITSQTALKRIE